MVKKKVDYRLSMHEMVNMFKPYSPLIEQYVGLMHNLYMALENNYFLYKKEDGYLYLFNIRTVAYVFIADIIHKMYFPPTENCHKKYKLNKFIISSEIQLILDDIGLITITKEIGDNNEVLVEYMNEVNRKTKLDNIIKKHRSESAKILLKNL